MARLRLLRMRADPIATARAPGPRDRIGFALSFAAAAVAHAALWFFLPRGPRLPPPTPAAAQVIELDPPPAPPEPPPSEPQQPPPARHAARPTAPAPAPAPRLPAASPPEVLSRAPDIPAPVDFMDTVLDGAGEAPARGQIAGPNAATGGSGPGAGARHHGIGPPPDADRSRRAAIVGGADWSCPFPPEADADRIDHAVVRLSLFVEATAEVSELTVRDDPGNGFGDAARRCALGRRFAAALDRHGRPVRQALVINVRFVR